MVEYMKRICHEIQNTQFWIKSIENPHTLTCVLATKENIFLSFAKIVLLVINQTIQQTKFKIYTTIQRTIILYKYT